MKLRLILISGILSIVPLILFQAYYYYSTESIIVDGLNKSNTVEITNTTEDISDKIESATGTLSLLSQLSLPRVSLEFSRPEALNELLEASNKRSGLFDKIIVLDSSFEFFASNDDGSDIFSLMENNQQIKDIAKEMASSNDVEIVRSIDVPNLNIVKFYVGAKIKSESNVTVGYLVGSINNKILNNSISRLRSRIRLSQKDGFLIQATNNLDKQNGQCAPIEIGFNNSLKLCVEYVKPGMVPWLGKNLIILLITIVILGFIYALIYQFVIGRILSPLYEFLKNLTKITEGIFVKQPEDSRYSEINSLISATNSIVDKLRINQSQELEKVRIEAVAKVATQAAHDIRSPLEMLKGIKEDLAPLPENSRRRIQMSINRIEEITFNLLKTHKQGSGLIQDSRPEELLSLVSSVLTEKKIEFRNSGNVEILELLDSNSYGLFSKVQRSAIKSIISNLINNAADSFSGQSGNISISLVSNKQFNEIRISDNGPGISAENKRHIFVKGFTTKKTGNGLGLFNAKQDIEAAGGEILFESVEGKGTSFLISLPKSETPSSFVGSIDPHRYERIIILDDDLAFHEVWKKRFEGLESKVEHIYSVKEMLQKYQGLHPKILLLSDFELMDKDLDGIDTILKLNHAQNSILVTARDEELEVQSRCLKAGIRLLPKSLVNYVKVETELSESSKHIDTSKLGIASMVGEGNAGGVAPKRFVSKSPDVVKFITNGEGESGSATPEALMFGVMAGTQDSPSDAYKQYVDEKGSRSGDEPERQNPKPQIVLIDDDRLVRLNWASHCSKKGLPFSAFPSIDEFLKSNGSFGKESKIYIDSNLGDGILGEIESEKIFALGFLNLYLATGFEKNTIVRPAWIKEIFSKSPQNIS